MPKTHRVELSTDDRRWLLEFIGRGEAPVREQTRARVLLKADEGPEGPAWSDDRIAEALELSSGLARQALSRRIPDRGTMEQRTTAWQEERNAADATVDWQFTTEEARIKLKRLYPKIDD